MTTLTSVTLKVLLVIVGFVALVLPAPLKMGQCGNSNRMKRWARLGKVVWPQELMPLTISVANSPRGFSIADIEDVALKCARLWGEPSSLSFQLATRGSTGNIAINFGTIDGSWGTTGYGVSPSIWGSNPSSSLKLDIAEPYQESRDPSGRSVSLTWAICHEMGHNLGLGHSQDRNAFMFSSGVRQDESRLPTDDRNGITRLYPGRKAQTIFGREVQSKPSSRPRPQTPRSQTRRPQTPRPNIRATRPPYRTTRRPRYPPRGHIPRYRPSGYRPSVYRPSGYRPSEYRNYYWQRG